MKRLLAFVLIIVLCDLALGAALDRVAPRVMTGEGVGVVNYALAQDADILVLGSSRAQHHVVPAVLGERLRARVFNAGLNGQDFLYATMLMDLWKPRHRPPRAIVLHVDPRSLVFREDELQVASVLARFAGQSEAVRDVLDHRGHFERLKRLSSAYRYNGRVLSVLKNLRAVPAAGFDGYVPLAGRTDAAEGERALHVASARASAAEPFWDFKLRYLERLVAYCEVNKVQLFLVHSPVLSDDRSAHDLWASRMQQLVAPYRNVAFIDISDLDGPRSFLGRGEWFKDRTHLNDVGAVRFTEFLSEELARRGAGRG